MHPNVKAKITAVVVVTICVVVLLWGMSSCAWATGVVKSTRAGVAYGSVDGSDGSKPIQMATLDFDLFPEKETRNEYPWPLPAYTEEPEPVDDEQGKSGEKNPNKQDDPDHPPAHLSDDWWENDGFLVWLERIIFYLGGVLTAMLGPRAKKEAHHIREKRRERKRKKEEAQ